MMPLRRSAVRPTPRPGPAFRAAPLFAWTAVLCAACLGACDRLAGKGGGTETESKVVAGRLVDVSGNPSVAARVILRPDDYLADPVSPVVSQRIQETVTDAQGRYTLRELPAGAYRIEFAGTESGGSIRDFSLARDSEGLVLPADTLTPRGSISGTFAPDSEVQLSRFVQVYGMERLVKADRAGGFVLTNMPEGIYDIRCSSLQPFRREAIRRGVVVHRGQQTTLGPIPLAKEAKLAFTIDSAGLRIDGVDSTNPVIMDNERWDNGIENEYLWAKASLGSLNLRGNIATNDFRAGRNTVAEQAKKGDAEVADAQRAGLTGIPGMSQGAAARLVLPASGRVEDMAPQPSAGSDLIVAEAGKATPEKPLVVIVGGPLTTVAQAWLTDPSIASRMVVVGIFSYTIQPQTDSLANYLVAKKCRFLDWGRNYTWVGALDAPRLADIPLSRMGERVRTFLAASPGLQSFGDLAPSAFLFRRGLWRTANMVKVSSKLEVQPASDITFDFLDIPPSANDWPLYSEEFFSTLSNPRVYHAAALPGRLPAEAMIGMTSVGRVVIDSAAGTVGAGFGTGSWADYKVSAAQAGDYRLTLRYRSGGGARVSIGLPGQPPQAEITLPPSAVWAEAALDVLPLQAGTYLLRLSDVSGTCNLEWMDFQP
jgi:hypothetical protein